MSFIDLILELRIRSVVLAVWRSLIYLSNFYLEATVDGATRSSKTVAKKGQGGLGSRKALKDITNKSSFHPEASIKKKDPQKEEFNVTEEMFLHDHQKCIEAQQAAFNNFDLNLVLPGHGN